MKLQYWLLIILLGAVWGCSFLFNAVLIREISPLWVSAGRVTIGAAICWLVFFATRKKLPTDPNLYWQFLILGILNYAVPFALFPFAEQTVASSIVGVINGMTPMTTVIVSQLWPGGEKASWNKVVGVAIGFAGAVILALPSLGVGASAQIIGLLAAFIATLCYALTLNYARRFAKVEPYAVASASLTGAALISVPVALFFSGIPIITRPETWGALFGISVFSTSFSFLLVYWLLPRVGATNLSLNTFITPISAILLGVLVLHERFELIHILGIIVIFLGLVFIDGRLVKGWRKAPA
ncbi:MAG TPA: DMT family transporter [Devosia sp.]|jgi:drug/metabolite transporter (DMT)-like permease|uniref:DMT family transporter n=1 Tax=Devosia sp. TaxID=1871048 RepID=UPI002DDC932C|nr:DMT family transporter [Devosia sp.]HEV2517291.1 DMT family transporter [Devosia sp.]